MIRIHYPNGATKDIDTNSEHVENGIAVFGSFRAPLSNIDGWEVLTPVPINESEEPDEKKGSS